MLEGLRRGEAASIGLVLTCLSLPLAYVLYFCFSRSINNEKAGGGVGSSAFLVLKSCLKDPPVAGEVDVRI